MRNQPLSASVRAGPAGQGRSLSAALRQLLEAFRYAQQDARSPWDFAVASVCLRRAGATDHWLRSLICQGYVEHAVETTRPGDASRAVRPGLGLDLHERSCFILTPAGLQWSLQCQEPAPEGRTSRSAVAENTADGFGTVPRPFWDEISHTLYWQARSIKRFRLDAPNQEAVLGAFQALGWPHCVAMVVARDGQVNPKDRLHDTIKNLNRAVRPYLHFRQEGSGTRVRWESNRRQPTRKHRRERRL